MPPASPLTEALAQINVVSVAVAFTPEGLPVCITLSLAKIASSLSKEKILCKSLSTVETLGSINCLCTDKYAQGDVSRFRSKDRC